MCLFTRARTVAIVFARSGGSEAMYCSGVLTFDGGFMDSSFSRVRQLFSSSLVFCMLMQGQTESLGPGRPRPRSRLSSMLEVGCWTFDVRLWTKGRGSRGG